MRKRVSAVPLAQSNRDQLRLRLKHSSPEKWPRLLEKAFEILVCELGLGEQAARSTIIASAAAAHTCSCKINFHSLRNVQLQNRWKLHNQFARIARCLVRASVAPRKRLNEQLCTLIHGRFVDLEFVEEIFETTVMVLREYPAEESFKTVLGIMTHSNSDGDELVVIKNDFSGLMAEDQQKAIAVLSKVTGNDLSASLIYYELSSALDDRKPKRIDTLIHPFIEEAVADLALIFLNQDLRPSRARIDGKLKYKSRFHCFADLVLAAFIEPSTLRHDEEVLNDLTIKTYANCHIFPADARNLISRALGQAHTSWLVNESHIRKAQHNFNKSTLDSP